MNSFEQIRNEYPDWGPAYLEEWEKPTLEELNRIQSVYGIKYPQEFINFQLIEGHKTPMGDFAWDNFGWACPSLEPMHNLAQIVKGAQQLGVPKSLAPFRDDNSDIFCFTETGEVVVWDHNSNSLYSSDKWPSFIDWLASTFDD